MCEKSNIIITLKHQNIFCKRQGIHLESGLEANRNKVYKTCYPWDYAAGQNEFQVLTLENLMPRMILRCKLKEIAYISA